MNVQACSGVPKIHRLSTEFHVLVWSYGLAGIPDVLILAIREGGVTSLFDQVRTLERAGSSLHVCGVDDVWEGEPRLNLVDDRTLRSAAFRPLPRRTGPPARDRRPDTIEKRPEAPNRALPAQRHAPIRQPGPQHAAPRFRLSLPTGDHRVGPRHGMAVFRVLRRITEHMSH